MKPLKINPGRYEVLDLLAVGGHAEVYYGRDRQSGADVVIKRLKPELLVRDRAFLQRFIREGTALSRLEHPNIVRMLATFEENGQHHIVIEYVPGGSLRQLLDKEGALEVQKALSIALELADALARAHHLNVIHRDLKPDNVLLAADGTPRLTDFGLARLRRDDSRLTRTGTVMGSPAYMSPEALRGEELDPRSDIWSFGVLLYEMLAGRKPFEGQQLTPVLVSILQDEAPPIVAFRPDIPPALANLLARMLQKVRTRRPLSMRQVAAELEAIAAGTNALFAAPWRASEGPEQATEDAPLDLSASASLAQAQTAAEEGPFVGREQTLGRLEALLKASVAGSVRLAFVTGEAGQGKTTLLQAFARRSQAQLPDLLVVGGNCNAYTGSGDPYLPFREILEMLMGDSEARAAEGELSEAHARRLQAARPHSLAALLETGPDLLETFVPARNVLQSAAALPNAQAPWLEQLRRLARARAQERLAPAQQSNLQQSDLFEQYARVLRTLSKNRPLLLYLDNLQWVDPGSANLLLHLGSSLQACAVMIVGAYRPADVALGRDGARHPLEATLFELQRIFGDVVLDLTQEEGRSFVEALLDSEPNRLDEAFRETLYRQTGGHPLFTVELLRSMQERGDLVRDEDGRWVARAQLDWNMLPARVEGAVGERIRRLAPELQELLEIASVEGEEFAAETVARVLRRDERATARQFSGELDRNHLLVRALGTRRAGSARLSRYRFGHILIQRYLYNSMDAVEKVYLHEAVGQALEALYDGEAALISPQLARHFQLAQLPEKAAVYLQQAGDQARHAIALAQATQYYQAALASWPGDDATARATILRKIGECLWILGDLQQALATYEDCYKLFESTGDLQGAGAVQRSMGRLYWEIGERERSLDYYHRSLETLQKIPESVELARSYSSISQMHMLASQYVEAITWGQRALDLARQLQADDVVTHALNNLGVAYVGTDRIEQGKGFLRESLEKALALGLPHDACRALLNLAEVVTGDYDEQRAVLEELSSYATGVRAALFAGGAQVELARLEWKRGQWRAALARRPEILSWMERAPSIGVLRTMSSSLFARVHNDVGQPGQALEHLQATLSLVRSQNEAQTLGPYLGQMARALAAKGRGEEAAGILQELLEAVQDIPYVHRNSVAPLLSAVTWLLDSSPAGRQPDAAAVGAALRCRQRLEKADAYGTNPEVGASLPEADGALLLARGEAREAATKLQDATAHWRELGLPYDEARAQVRLARAQQQTGDLAGMQAAARRAATLLGALAEQLDEQALRESFLRSVLFQAIGEIYPAALEPVTGAEKEAALQEAGGAEHTPQEAAQIAAHNLPVQPTRFVGRRREVAEMQGILADQPECRLLTLVGPGGIGKTRLALAVAARLVPRFKQGVLFVPLAPLSSPEHIVSTLMEILDLAPPDGREPRLQLLAYLQKRQLLLVFDNFEHLLEGAGVVAEILEQAPQVKVLVTSRERLNLSQETLYDIGGLDYPPATAQSGALDEEKLRRYSAVDLLLQRAKMVAPGLAFEQDDLQQAVRICNMVQGMPLALVLAAGWLELLSFEEIADELSQSLAVLESTARDLPERQRSVHAAFDYSWKRLAAADRRAFMALSVFRGGFTRQAAQRVAEAGLRTLRTLVNKSFVSTNRKGRFEIHEVLRQLGWEQLQASGVLETTQQVHSAYYLSALRERESDLHGGRQLGALEEIEVELENVRVAWNWALQNGDSANVDAALEAIFLFGYMPSRYTEAIELLQAARDRLAPPPGRSASATWGRVVARLAFLLAHARPEQALTKEVDAALALARQNEDRGEIAFSLLAKGCLTVYVGRDAQAAIATIEEALQAYEALDDHFYVVLAKIWLGYCHGNATGLSQFNRYMREALALAQATDNQVYGANATSNLAAGAFCEGDYRAAERFSREALEVAEEMGLRLAIAHGKVQLSIAHLLEGDLERARKLAQAGLEEAREISYATTISYALSVSSLCRSLLGEGAAAEQAEEALATPTTVFGRILAEWAASLAACGNADYASAAQHAMKSIETAHEAGYPGMTTWAVPVLAAALAAGDEKEDAVALLALATSHPVSPRGWTERSALLSETQHQLLQRLGPDLYQRAWQRGLALDLGETIGRLLSGEPVGREAPRQRRPNNLPAPATPLVGRDKELAELQRLFLETPTRLVTLEGPGGMGKTRLALAVAAALAPACDDGVFFVPLATLTGPEQLPAALAERLAFRFYSNTDLEQQLVDFLSERRILLVLDNFEQLLEGATLVANLLAGAAELRVLVTSRERLNIGGETIYALQGLEYPAGEPNAPFAAGAAECGAVQLLLWQARRTAPQVTPDAKELAEAVRIARLVQGMPLALLLAAGWFSLLSFKEIADEIEKDLDFLQSAARDLPPRQQSMRAVFDGSWKMLDTEERRVLSQLSVFRGTFKREAAESIAQAPPRALLNLIGKSWLQRAAQGRFQIHELLRQYAAEKLKRDVEAWEGVRQRHAAYYARFLEAQLAPLRGPEQVQVYAEIQADFNNVLLAWRTLVEQRAFDVIVDQMLPALIRCFETWAESSTLVQLLEEAVAAFCEVEGEGNEARRAVLLLALGAFFRNGVAARFAAYGMVLPAREEVVREAWALAAGLGGLGSVLWDATLAYTYGHVIDREEGIAYLKQRLAGPDTAPPWELAFALQSMALLLMLRPATGDQSSLDEAYQLLDQALAIFEAVDDPRERGITLRSLGQILRLKRQFSEAIEPWLAAQSQLEEIGEWTLAADINWQIGDAYLQMGDVETALAYYRKMSEVYLNMGQSRLMAMVLSHESYEAARYGYLEDALRTREEALAISRDVGHQFAEAWNLWEMGELLRLSGDAVAARDWYEQARALFEKFGDAAGATFYHRGLGDLALAEEKYAEAQKEFKASVDHAEATDHKWAMAYALAGMGLASTRLGQMDDARRQLASGLRQGRESGEGGVILRALAVAAHYFHAVGDGEQAAALATLVAQHPTAWQESKAIVKALGGPAALQGDEQALDYWGTAEQMLAKLAGGAPAQGAT